ncbi:hypothetical protein [Thermococcus sp.]|uniref:hypothetical protein n=1 Tax=Thermococcus sp. TaxID=35749 RepID=UPI0025F01962|nr:hypothetical protein [Thermococcus sp.]
MVMTSVAIRVPEGVDIEFAKRLAKLVEKRLAELTRLNSLLMNSELTDEDIEKISEEIGRRRTFFEKSDSD